MYNPDYEAAKAKLEAEGKAVSGQREKAVLAGVTKALLTFCEQSPRFSEAVCAGGSLADCCKAVVKGVGASLSDYEAYSRAVKFYLPEAEVQFEMRILEGARDQGQPSGDSIISLMDLL